MESLSSVCRRPSVTPPVLRLSITKFSQDWIISFFLVLYMTIAGHDIWRLTKPNFWKEKKIGGPNLSQTSQNQAQN